MTSVAFDPRERDRRRDRRNSAWKARFPELVTCVRCLEQKDVEEMDRLLWCEECRDAAVQRAARIGWAFGTLCAVGLAVWIRLTGQSTEVIPGAWLGAMAAALWIGSRVGREIAYGVMRVLNRRAVEAVPPSEPPPAA